MLLLLLNIFSLIVMIFLFITIVIGLISVSIMAILTAYDNICEFRKKRKIKKCRKIIEKEDE